MVVAGATIGRNMAMLLTKTTTKRQKGRIVIKLIRYSHKINQISIKKILPSIANSKLVRNNATI